MNSAVGASPETLSEPQIAYGREFWLAYFAHTALIVCNSSLFRYFDFVSFLGGDEYDLGMITGFGMGGAVLARFAQGTLIDRVGPRVVWLGSLVLLIVALLGHFWVTTIDSPLIYGLRLCYMVGLAGAFGASITSISLKAPKGRGTELIGVLGSSGFIGLGIGPVLGDYIFAENTPLETKVHLMFLVAMTAGGVAFVLTLLATWKERPRPAGHHPSLVKLIRQYHPGWMLVMAFAMGMGVIFPQIFLRGYAKEVGIANIGSFFLVYAITAFTFRLMTRRLPEQIGVKKTATIGILTMAASLVMYMVVHNPWLLPIPAFLCGVAHALLFPAIIGGGSIAFPKKYRGTGTNLMLVLVDSGGLVGQPLIGAMIAGCRVLDWPAYPLTFISMGCFLSTIALLNQRFAKPIIAQEDELHEVEERSLCANENL
ncbi:MFS transporter [Bremerella cremea]|nr:MFS transporter [Bremerella cremea]